jgi:hypothetical protein
LGAPITTGAAIATVAAGASRHTSLNRNRGRLPHDDPRASVAAAASRATVTGIAAIVDWVAEPACAGIDAIAASTAAATITTITPGHSSPNRARGRLVHHEPRIAIATVTAIGAIAASDDARSIARARAAVVPRTPFFPVPWPKPISARIAPRCYPSLHDGLRFSA